MDRAYTFYHDLIGLEKLEYVEHHVKGVSEMVAMTDVGIKR